METALSEIQELLKNSIRDLLHREVTLSEVRALEASGGYDEKLWGQLHSSGYLALPFSGGDDQGGQLTDLAVVVEELTRVAAVVPFTETALCALVIQKFAPPLVAAQIVEGVIDGKITIAPALLEANDEYLEPKITTAGTVISGQKMFVDYGLVTTHHLVSALQDGQPALFLVEATPTAVSSQRLHGISRLPQANVTFEDAPATRVGGRDALEFLIHVNSAFASIQCLGNAQQALDMSVEYVKNRVQFGRPIGSFQAVQHHCANMATMVEALRFLAYELVWNIDQGDFDLSQIALVKNWAARSVTEVTTLAHQLHGGIGVTEDYDLHFFTRRGKDRAIAWGTSEESLAVVASSIEDEDRARSPKSAFVGAVTSGTRN